MAWKKLLPYLGGLLLLFVISLGAGASEASANTELIHVRVADWNLLNRIALGIRWIINQLSLNEFNSLL